MSDHSAQNVPVSSSVGEPVEQIGVYVAGVRYHSREPVLKLRLWDHVELRRDPTNKHDPNAILVLNSEGETLGFIPREVAANLASFMDRNQIASLSANVTGLRSSDAQDQTSADLRIRISTTVPKSWHELIAGIPSQIEMEYVYEDTRDDIYVLFNSDERTYHHVKRALVDELEPASGSGLCYRPADNGRDYQWYIKFDRSSGVSEDLIEEFFRVRFGVISDRERRIKMEQETQGLWQEIEALEAQRTEWENYAVDLDQGRDESSESIESVQAKIEEANYEVEIRDKAIHVKDRKIKELTHALNERELASSARATRDEDIPENVIDTLRAISEHTTPHISLLVIKGLWPDRIEVLDSAYESAKQAKQFKYPKKVFDLLWKLATDYWSCLARGVSDEQCRQTFRKAYAAKESDTAQDNKNAIAHRTFSYDGRSVVMTQHLKCGVKDSPHETLRIHFFWDSDKRKIIIGHCGSHLPLR